MHSSNGSLFWVYNGKNNCRYATDSLSNFNGKHALLDFHLSCLLKSNSWIRNCRNVHLKLKKIKQRKYLKKQQQQQQNGIKRSKLILLNLHEFQAQFGRYTFFISNIECNSVPHEEKGDWNWLINLLGILIEICSY